MIPAMSGMNHSRPGSLRAAICGESGVITQASPGRATVAMLDYLVSHLHRRMALLAFLSISFVAAGCERNLPGTLPTLEARIGGHPLTVEVADSLATRTAGLKGRESLAPNHGMLFVFPRSQELAFYMKDTPLPLDIGFFDEQGFLIQHYSMHPDDGKNIYTSGEPAIYAVETNLGWYDEKGLGKYAKLELPQPVTALD